VRHLEEAREIWSNYVPAKGQADTVQGELLRAVEKLRDEAVRNGNINWDDSHETLVGFLGDNLITDDVFGPEALAEIETDLRRARDMASPPGDDLYDQLADRAVEWCLAHPDPIAHAPDPSLRR